MSEIMFIDVAGGVLLILLGMMLLIGFCSNLELRKSKKYRKEVMDMYVAAKTKDLASKENLDLVKEYESFKKWNAKQMLVYSNKELDDVIEQELKEKVAEVKEVKK